MKPTPAPIPIPWSERKRDLRMMVAPAVVFFSAIIAIAFLWKNNLSTASLVGQAEPSLVSVSCHKSGVLAGFSATRFQNVKAGDPLGYILIADPKLLEASLAVIHADINVLRLNLAPIAAQQRNAVDYLQLRLDWMRERANLAGLRVSLQLAEVGLRRTNDLFKEKITSPNDVDHAVGLRDGLQKQVEELTTLVNESEANFKNLQPVNTTNLLQVSDAPLQAAIAVQEAKLRQTEAELSPITLTSPVTGMISAIHFHSGESVTAGQPVVDITAVESQQIITYLRQPILKEPQIGATVEVRLRGAQRAMGQGKIIHLGSQFEAIPSALQWPIKLASAEVGLPVSISVPGNLPIRPGELVDLTLHQ